MPRKPKRPCSYPGCPKLTDGRFCEEHQRKENQRYEKYGRDPAAKRRYGRAWKRIREENVGLTVEIPLNKVSLGNLTKLLEAKGKLIRKALGISELSMEILEDRVTFPWFEELPDSDAVKAYTHFISALCEMSRNAKRVTVTEKAVDNEKYAFRCFLLRLGFIGSEYKAERKILLKNLTGSSAFKDGGVNHEVSE